MKVLVTSGGGFIGSHQMDSQLAKGHEVRCVDLYGDRLERVANSHNLDIVTGDITETQAAERIMDDIVLVYHLASAYLDVSLSEERYRHMNVDGTVNLLKAAQSAGVKCFVHCSSVGVMGDIKNPPADETYPCNPTKIFEKTKLAGERTALEFSQEMGLHVVVVRPAWVYGSRCPRTQKLFRAIDRGRFPIFGDGQNLHHPVYVADCVHGLDLCAEADWVSGQVNIIAGSEPVTIEELTRTIAETRNVPLPKFHLLMVFGKLAAKVMQFTYKPIKSQPSFSEGSLGFYPNNNAYDIEKARQEWGYVPQFDLREGLELTLN